MSFARLGLGKALNHGREQAGGGEDDGRDEGDDQQAELRAGKVLEVLVGGGDGENDDNDPADEGDTKEDLIPKIAPHRDRGVLGGDFAGF